MKKKGEFYLIAALVIIGIIAGLTSIYNKTKTSAEDLSVYDLSDQINYEAGAVIDSGTYNEKNKGEIKNFLVELLNFYAQTNPGNDLVVIYGDMKNLTLIYFNNTETGSIGIDFGSGTPVFTIEGTSASVQPLTAPPGSNSVRVILDDGVIYNFDLQPGQSFYLILRKESNDEKFVSAPESSS